MLTPLSDEVQWKKYWLNRIFSAVRLNEITLHLKKFDVSKLKFRYFWSALFFLSKSLLRLSRSVFRVTTRVIIILFSELRIQAIDLYDRWRASSVSIRRIESGLEPCLNSCSVAIMASYNPNSIVSEMVIHQIRAYRDAGFAVIFVSNSPEFRQSEWDVVRREVALLIHRDNRGLDFGAWKDIVPIAFERWPKMYELLLVNDSVMGPVYPISKIFEAMRAAGKGLFGLLESTQYRPHFQSWFTLTRGREALDDVAGFFREIKLSRSKLKIIQRGELRMAHAMRLRGHYVAAFLGYERLIDMTLDNANERAYLQAALPYLTEQREKDGMRKALLENPINPAHEFWRTLLVLERFPFIKTELVLKNPDRLPGVESWRDLIPPDSPCSVQMLDAHIAGQIEKPSMRGPHR